MIALEKEGELEGSSLEILQNQIQDIISADLAVIEQKMMFSKRHWAWLKNRAQKVETALNEKKKNPALINAYNKTTRVVRSFDLLTEQESKRVINYSKCLIELEKNERLRNVFEGLDSLNDAELVSQAAKTLKIIDGDEKAGGHG